jgi:hypothetical protein
MFQRNHRHPRAHRLQNRLIVSVFGFAGKVQVWPVTAIESPQLIPALRRVAPGYLGVISNILGGNLSADLHQVIETKVLPVEHITDGKKRRFRALVMSHFIKVYALVDYGSIQTPVGAGVMGNEYNSGEAEFNQRPKDESGIQVLCNPAEMASGEPTY